jgi:hypothetical protein
MHSELPDVSGEPPDAKQLWGDRGEQPVVANHASGARRPEIRRVRRHSRCGAFTQHRASPCSKHRVDDRRLDPVRGHRSAWSDGCRRVDDALTECRCVGNRAPSLITIHHSLSLPGEISVHVPPCPVPPESACSTSVAPSNFLVERTSDLVVGKDSTDDPQVREHYHASGPSTRRWVDLRHNSPNAISCPDAAQIRRATAYACGYRLQP